MSVHTRHNINILGSGPKTLLFAHGFGCDQNMWRFVVPEFEREYRIVLFDHVGAGKSDASEYSRARYGALNGYADDVLQIIDAVGGAPVIYVGHSVSAMIGVLAAIRAPAKFEHLILVGPHRATSTTASTSADLAAVTSKASLRCSTAIISAGQAQWHP